MAVFDTKPTQERPENYLNYSRGIDSSRNDAMATLFGGVADFAGQIVQTKDADNQRQIQRTIFEETDAIQDEFGVGDATLFQEDAEAEKPLPSQLSSSGENLDRLQAAYERGALKESHYWARLNSMVRQLRGQYPGYRDEIDKMVSQTTGARPANALRSALFDEWHAAASETTPTAKLEDWALKQGRLPPDYYKRQEEGTPYTFGELQKYVAGKTRETAERDDRRASMAELSDQDSLTKKQVTRNFSVDTTQYVQSVLYDTTKVIGGNYATLSAQITKAQKAASEGNPMDANELNNLRGSIGQLKLAVSQGLQQEFLTPWDDNPQHSYVSQMTPEESKAIMDQAMAPIALLEDALAGDNPYAVLKSIAAYTEAGRDQASREMVDSIPLVQRLQAVQNLLGPEATGLYMSLNTDVMDALTQSFLDDSRASALTDDQASITSAFDRGEQNELGPEYYNGLIDGWTKTLATLETKELPLEAIQKNVDFMFGPASAEVLGRMDDASRFDYFKRVASPVVSNQMLKLKKMGDIESWDNYQQWVTRGFLSLFQSKVATLQGASSSLFHPGMRVVWDDPNAAFRLYDTTPVRGDPLTQAAGTPDLLVVNSAIADLNTAIQVVKPVLEENGGSPGPEVYELLRQMGFNPETQQDFLSMMMSAVGSMFPSAEPEEGPVTPSVMSPQTEG